MRRVERFRGTRVHIEDLKEQELPVPEPVAHVEYAEVA